MPSTADPNEIIQLLKIPVTCEKHNEKYERCTRTLLLRQVEAAPEDIEFIITVSFVEIYMERIRDLLDKTRQKNNLDVRVDIQKGVYVDGATEVQVRNWGIRWRE